MKLSTKLENMKGESDLKDYVIDYILDDYKTDDEIKSFFKDLQQAGCQSGMVSSLIYYKDTHAFYNDFASEIDQLKEETEESSGEPLQIKGDVRNWLAWFAFEETAYNIFNELDLE